MVQKKEELVGIQWLMRTLLFWTLYFSYSGLNDKGLLMLISTTRYTEYDKLSWIKKSLFGNFEQDLCFLTRSSLQIITKYTFY